MKHRVKVIRAEDGLLHLRVDGVECAYFVKRPTPLGPADAHMLQLAMDTRVLGSLFDLALQPRRSFWSLLKKLCIWKRRGSIECLTYELRVASFIAKVGIEVDIDDKTKGVVLLKSDVEKIERGEL